MLAGQITVDEIEWEEGSKRNQFYGYGNYLLLFLWVSCEVFFQIFFSRK